MTTYRIDFECGTPNGHPAHIAAAVDPAASPFDVLMRLEAEAKEKGYTTGKAHAAPAPSRAAEPIPLRPTAPQRPATTGTSYRSPTAAPAPTQTTPKANTLPPVTCPKCSSTVSPKKKNVQTRMGVADLYTCETGENCFKMWVNAA